MLFYFYTSGLRVVFVSRSFTGMGDFPVTFSALLLFSGGRITFDFSFRAQIGRLVVSVFCAYFFSMSYRLYTFLVLLQRVRQSDGVVRGRKGRPI